MDIKLPEEEALQEEAVGRSVNRLVFICVDASAHSVRAFYWFYNNLYRENHIVGIVHVHSKCNDDNMQEETKKRNLIIQGYFDR